MPSLKNDKTQLVGEKKALEHNQDTTGRIIYKSELVLQLIGQLQ